MLSKQSSQMHADEVWNIFIQFYVEVNIRLDV